MTLRDLITEAERGDPDRLLTITEVVRVTGRPRATIKRWVYTDRVMESEQAGPYNHRHVRASVVLRMFCPHIVRTFGRHASPDVPQRGPVRPMGMQTRVTCGPFPSPAP